MNFCERKILFILELIKNSHFIWLYIFQHNFKDHVTFMGAMKNHGLAVIDFKRSIMPHDSVDAPIPMEGPVQVRNESRFLLS